MELRFSWIWFVCFYYSIWACDIMTIRKLLGFPKMKVFWRKRVNTNRYASMIVDQEGLIAACKEGDEAAVMQLIQEHQLGVFRLALSVLNDPFEANEAAQDTFIAALRGLNSYRETSSFKAWLFTIALNISRSRLRKLKAQERLQQTLTTLFRVHSQSPPTLEEKAVSNEEEAALWNALEKLGEKHRLPIVLRYYHDFSIKEIAEILRIKEGTVHSRLSIAREKLRAELEGLFRTTGE
jgi:RNA polymerase sigma-70 factor, ECF subfamily